MKKNVKIIVIIFMVVIAINITVVMIAFAGKSHEPVHNPGSSVANMATPTTGPTAEPTASTIPTEPPDATPTSTQSSGTTPTATSTSASTPTQGPTGTANPTPTQTSSPTATQPGSTPTPTGTQTAAPTPTPTPTTIVSISTVSQVNKGNTFTVDVNINNVDNMAFAQFDIKFNYVYVNYSSYNSQSQIGGGTGTVYASWMEPGLVRILVDYGAYAEAHDDNGISGSGYLCKLTFTTIAQGISPLEFVEGQGSPEGYLELSEYYGSLIEPVGWTDGSITIVP